jgi:hypothetical protein
LELTSSGKYFAVVSLASHPLMYLTPVPHHVVARLDNCFIPGLTHDCTSLGISTSMCEWIAGAGQHQLPQPETVNVTVRAQKNFGSLAFAWSTSEADGGLKLHAQLRDATTGSVLIDILPFEPLRGTDIPAHHRLVATGEQARRARRWFAAASLASAAMLTTSIYWLQRSRWPR